MPSRADLRQGLERASRAGALAVIALLFWRAGTAPDAVPVTVRDARGLPAALVDATINRVPSLFVQLDSIPGVEHRAWMAALQRTGTRVGYAGTSLPVLALASEPLVDPQGGTRLTVMAPAGAPLALRDASGLADDATVQSSGVRVVESLVSGAVEAGTPHAAARGQARDSVVLRPVLVLGRADWEGRFAAAALQEAGWQVDVDFQVVDPGAPAAASGIDVRTPGAAEPIDTSRYSAVVALDESVARRAAAIGRFVQTGGGLVVAGTAARVPALRSLAPAQPGARFEGLVGSLLGIEPRRGLAGTALEVNRPDAAIVERRGRIVTVAARREQLGRVLSIGYVDTWRWRMEGGPTSVDDHRLWWSGIVGAVARPVLRTAGPDSLVRPVASDPAPYAGLVALLGKPASGPANSSTMRWDLWLLALSMGLLLIEWTSRRTRGAT